MLGKHALDMLSWTRRRTMRILDSLPVSFIYKPVKNLENQPFKSPAEILEHVAYAEKMYMHYVLGGKTLPVQDFTFEGKTKSFILKYLEETRYNTVKWLEERKETELNDIMFNRRTHMGWVFHHIPEHEAHHVGQIVVLALMAGIEVPNV